MIRVKNFLKVSKDPRQWCRGLLGCVIGISFVFVVSCFFKIVINETDSLPQRYFIQLPHMKAGRDQYTLTFSNWYQGNIIKKIVGIEGDKVWYDQEGVLWVNDYQIGAQMEKATDGSHLTPLKAQIIPKGYVFLYSNHVRSFDSRYQELGLIPVSLLKGRVIPLG